MAWGVWVDNTNQTKPSFTLKSLEMIVPYNFIVVYPLLTFNTIDCSNQIPNSLVPYKPYTTSNVIENLDPKDYEKVWNQIIKEGCDSNSMVE